MNKILNVFIALTLGIGMAISQDDLPIHDQFVAYRFDPQRIVQGHNDKTKYSFAIDGKLFGSPSVNVATIAQLEDNSDNVSYDVILTVVGIPRNGHGSIYFGSRSKRFSAPELKHPVAIIAFNIFEIGNPGIRYQASFTDGEYDLICRVSFHPITAGEGRVNAWEYAAGQSDELSISMEHLIK